VESTCRASMGCRPRSTGASTPADRRSGVGCSRLGFEASRPVLGRACGAGVGHTEDRGAGRTAGPILVGTRCAGG
jgi:hypothetical protein